MDAVEKRAGRENAHTHEYLDLVEGNATKKKKKTFFFLIFKKDVKQ